MRIKGVFVCLAICIVSCVHINLFAKSKVGEEAFKDLSILEHLIDVKYAPKAWKESLFNWFLLDATNQAKKQLILEENPSVSYCQKVLSQYFASLNDYHAGLTFYATEQAYLPYTLKLSDDGRCFVVDVHTYASTIVEGDELLEFDGCSIKDSLFSVCRSRGSDADFATSIRHLTFRTAALGQEVPSGIVNLKIRRPNGLERTVAVKWRYTPEHIADFSLISPLVKEPRIELSYKYNHHNFNKIRPENSLFTNQMVPYFWSELRNHYRKGFFSDYNIGSKRGFLPHFGSIVWEATTGPFHAYIFCCVDKNGNNRKIGFLRLATYAWMDTEEDVFNTPWVDFAELIRFFSEETEGLIIDQTNNPGGSVLYMYGLLSMLTDQPLNLPKHRMILTQDEVQAALNWLELLENVETDLQAQDALGTDMEGYPMNMVAVGALQDFAQQILKSWSSGDICLSKPIPLLGFSQILPHPDVRYIKPICVLINEENFSCADLFPAIMKDNGRALLIGNTTAGAGGFVFNVEFPNRLGIKSCSLTGSLAVRNDGSFIENLGVAPHIQLKFSAKDIQNGSYADYIAAVNEHMLQHIEQSENQN